MAGAMLTAACDDSGGGQIATPDGGAPVATATAAGPRVITIRNGEPLKIGISTALSTDARELGRPIRAAAEYALRQKATVRGFRIEAVTADDMCMAAASKAAAEQLIGQKVAGVLGPMCSGGAVASFRAYRGGGIVVISGSAVEGAVSQQGAEFFFRTAWSRTTQGAEMAKFASNTLRMKRAVLVDDQSDYGKRIVSLFDSSYAELDGEIVARASVTVNDVSVSDAVAAIARAAPEIVIFGGFSEAGAALVRGLRAAGVTAAFMGGDALADQEWIDAAQGAADGAYVSRGPMPAGATASAAFAAAFAAETGTQPGEFAGEYFDAANVLVDAIDKSATLDAEGNLVIDEAKLIAQVRATDTVGASGPIRFDASGDRVVVPGIINRIDRVRGDALERVQ